MADLPDIIPIFPLPNFVLFPGIRAPLHIFEPRYREMVAEVSQSHGIIGMMMLKGDWQSDYHTFPDIFEVGCAGVINQLVRLPDGRFNLLLDGTREFRVVREIRERSYRLAEVEWLPTKPEELELEPAAAENLRDLLINFLGESARKVWDSLVQERGLGGAALINFICFHLDVAPIEKQTLLEARASRAACLTDILTFKLEERKLGPTGPAGGSTPNQ